MRLWSIAPEYLDRPGLLAVWREGLLAKQVLSGRTKGYRHHPQLERFKASPRPLAYLNAYLFYIYQEALRRGYAFSRIKIRKTSLKKVLSTTNGQLDYEFNHLKRKLKARSPERYQELKRVKKIKLHPLFHRVSGPVARWEKIK